MVRSLPAWVQVLTFMVEVVDVVGAGHRHLLAGGALRPADNPVPLWKAAGVWPTSKGTSHFGSKQGHIVTSSFPKRVLDQGEENALPRDHPWPAEQGEPRGGMGRGTHPITSHLLLGGWGRGPSMCSHLPCAQSSQRWLIRMMT